MRTSDSLRIGDAERDAAIAALARHFADGRLTQDEHEDRTAQALRARTGGDLRLLFNDLPRLDEPPRTARRSPDLRSRRVLQPIVSGLMVAAGVLLALHLVSVIVLIAFAFVAARLFFGVNRARSWTTRANRSCWRSWDKTGGSGFFGH